MYSASANSSLDAKYRYASPRLAPASRATSRIVVASYPLSANNPSAASRIRSLVRRAFGVNLIVGGTAPDGVIEAIEALKPRLPIFFSVHGTGVPMHADHYNADLWAYLVDELGTLTFGELHRRPPHVMGG